MTFMIFIKSLAKSKTKILKSESGKSNQPEHVWKTGRKRVSNFLFEQIFEILTLKSTLSQVQESEGIVDV